LEDFLEVVATNLNGARPARLEAATQAVFRTLARHVDAGQVRKVVDALPAEIRRFWREGAEG
jgi:uncharacterized protein (DUF2267 family)